MAKLPGGTVTLLFTDIEGSTDLLQRLGERYRAVLEEFLATADPQEPRGAARREGAPHIVRIQPHGHAEQNDHDRHELGRSASGGRDD